MGKWNDIKPTIMQKRGVDNLLSGKYKHIKPALMDAGYTKKSASNPKDVFFNKRGVEVYLKTLSKVAKKRWNMSLGDKVSMTYLDGLESTKLYGKNAKEHPDFATRLAYADRFSKFFGWSHEEQAPGSKNVQFNFFSVGDEDRQNFNEHFKQFLKQL